MLQTLVKMVSGAAMSVQAVNATIIASEIEKHGPALQQLKQQHPQLADLLNNKLITCTPKQVAEFLMKDHSPITDPTGPTDGSGDAAHAGVPDLPGMPVSTELPASLLPCSEVGAASSAVEALPATLKMPDMQKSKHMPLFHSSEHGATAEDGCRMDAAQQRAVQADAHCCTIADLVGISPRPRPVCTSAIA